MEHAKLAQRLDHDGRTRAFVVAIFDLQSQTQSVRPLLARQYARDYLTMLENQIRTVTKQEPSAEMVYAAYNVGFGRLQSLGFDIAKTRSHTKAACARLRELISSFQNPSEQATAQLATK